MEREPLNKYWNRSKQFTFWSVLRGWFARSRENQSKKCLCQVLEYKSSPLMKRSSKVIPSGQGKRIPVPSLQRRLAKLSVFRRTLRLAEKIALFIPRLSRSSLELRKILSIRKKQLLHLHPIETDSLHLVHGSLARMGFGGCARIVGFSRLAGIDHARPKDVRVKSFFSSVLLRKKQPCQWKLSNNPKKFKFEQAKHAQLAARNISMIVKG